MNQNVNLNKYIFRCNHCTTIMSIETEIDIDLEPMCPCGKSAMYWLGSHKAKYGPWD